MLPSDNSDNEPMMPEEEAYESIIGGSDERERPDDYKERLWRPICAIYFNYPGESRGRLGSGVLIGPRLVLTAAHNLFDLKTRQPIMGGEVRVGVTGAKHEAASPISTVQVPKPYKKQDPSKSRKYNYDYGLILLQNENAYNWAGDYWSIDDMAPMPKKTLLSNELTVAGYPAKHKDIGAGTALMVSKGTLKKGSVASKTMAYEMDTTGGQSGCPVFHHDDASDEIRLAGIHVAGFENRANLAKRFDPTTKTHVQGWVQTMLQSFA